MLENMADFQQVLAWAIAHGYTFIFLVMCLEGPMITAASGFAAALGFFNPWVILVLSILGDLVPDSIYYLIGYIGRFAVIERIAHRLGLNQERIRRIEEHLKKHFGKTMIALKLTPVVPTPGFMLVGYLRLSFVNFTKYSAAVTLPKTIIFLVIGYFFGQLYNINQYLHYAEVIFPLTVVILMLIYFGQKKLSEIIAKKVEKI
jgi:membrane protein DedA with SNARE-associated domain